MPTAYSQNLIQFINSFGVDFSNASAQNLPLGELRFRSGTVVSVGGYAERVFVRCTSSISNPAGTIVLPNGVKYDPHQVYDAPKIPGTVDVYVRLKPSWSNIQSGTTTLAKTESAIMAYYAEASAMVGYRGTLTGYHAYFASATKAATATARLIGLNCNWGPPKQVPAQFGGPGAQVGKGIETAEIRATFDLLTNWEWDIYG